MIKRIVGTFILAALTASCGSDSDDDTQIVQQNLKFLSQQQACTGEAQMLCLVKPKAEEIELFYNNIEGFSYQWGHTYELKVDVTKQQPNADDSELSYKLVSVVSEVEDALGTTYELKLVELLESTVTKDAEGYYLLGKAFTCAAGTDCDALVAMNNSGGLVNLTFSYTGEGKIALTNWN